MHPAPSRQHWACITFASGKYPLGNLVVPTNNLKLLQSLIWAISLGKHHVPELLHFEKIDGMLFATFPG